MGKMKGSRHRESDKQYLNPAKEPRTAKCHLQHIKLANTHTHKSMHLCTHIHTSITVTRKWTYSVLLAALTGMNANRYNIYEGAIWQHTGNVCKMSTCGSFESTVKMTLGNASGDLASQWRSHTSENSVLGLSTGKELGTTWMSNNEGTITEMLRCMDTLCRHWRWVSEACWITWKDVQLVEFCLVSVSEKSRLRNTTYMNHCIVICMYVKREGEVGMRTGGRERKRTWKDSTPKR